MDVGGSSPSGPTMRNPNGTKTVQVFVLVRVTKLCVIPQGLLTPGELERQASLLASESEETARNPARDY